MRMLCRSVVSAVLVLFISTSLLTAQESQGNNRVGLWGGFGLGGGVLGCLEDGCDGSEWGYSGNAKLGGTLSPSVRIGGGTNGWYKNEDGVTLTGGLLSAQILWNPNEGDLFLVGGVGYATFRASVGSLSETENGGGLVFGLGYDISIKQSGSLALTPYVNWIVTSAVENASFHFVQFGLGLTFN
jgi:hypothetical protein